MSFKKRGSSKWTDTPNYIMGTFTDTITTLPADIYPTGTTATIGLKGQMEQNGTPTPTTPIQPSECGERTGNLLPFTDKLFSVTAGNSNLTVECKNGNLFFQGNAGEIGSSQAIWKNNFAFELEAGTYYCNSPVPLGQGFGRYIKKYDDNTTILASTNYTFTLSEKTKCFLSFYIYQKTLDSQVEIMLNSGSSAVPYEPYGYKIPILSAGQTTTVYLGEVETTRRIKKLVLTGEENWQFYSDDLGAWQFHISNISLGGVPTSSCMSNIAPYGVNVNTRHKYDYGCYLITSGNGVAFQMKGDKDTLINITSWKSYLAQQYAAGIPVIVWYVLAEPTTGIVNEPIRKIGDYADTVSGITIPTITGANTIDVNTTLKPSEMSVNYKGWHPVIDVHKAENGQWN